MNSMTASAEFASGMQKVREYGSLETPDEQDKALAEIQQAFADNSGRIASAEDIQTVEILIEGFADVNEISSVAAAAGFALASALPAAKQGAPAWRLASSWSATMRAVEFIQHSQKITEMTGSADDDGDIVFGQCLASLRAWKKELGSGVSGCTISSTASGPRSFLQDVLGKDTQHLSLSTAVSEVEKWVRQRVQRQSGSKREAWSRAIEKLEDIAGGKSGGGSWKEKLVAQSSWDDVQNEAGYHFVIKVDGKNDRQLHEVMDDIFLELRAAKTDLENAQKYMDEAQVSGSGLPETALPVILSRRMIQAQKKAEITHTESFFHEVITGHGASKSIMIQRRMESMSARAIESDSLQPAIWRKAQLLGAARRRPNEPATPAVFKQAREPRGGVK